MTNTRQFDIVIIGAGPAGLSLARSLAGSGQQIAIVEMLNEAILANPPEDGRDIALTHTSEKLMHDLGMWQHIPEDQIGTIRDAKVINGKSNFALHFDSLGSGADYLGKIIPNHLIRQAAYKEAKELPNVTLICESEVTTVHTDTTKGTVGLADGSVLECALVVAADSRFSSTRRKMGIPAKSLDFGRVVIVCEMQHELSHNDTAFECFHYDQTLAILPMYGTKSSVVVTLPSDMADAAMAMSDDEFSADIEQRFGGQLGKMTLVSKRFPYPLVGVLAKHFAATRFALVGDAAVGMHPVTAHGFNLGLSGAKLLADQIEEAARNMKDIGADAGLQRYETAHRRVVLPLYHGTNALVKLYTDNSVPGRVLRGAALRAGNFLSPLKKRIMHQLTHIESHAK
ncbi:MAG TPA: FAD-dependent hydroxylase [Rhodobacteraceae bacterium]|jgi:ubiquinone biosynthesis UbiH/UbiF/VisC/COQ6 family hydroxylase|nr:FAD-dependent hydroxylase [Paracoccaceae bacterium]